MHMADALLTPAVAGVMYAASAVVAGASIVELHKEEKQDLTSAAKKLPTMAVMSALVFAGQMINYTIPGTGSSGHLCGGLLLTSVLGPWAGFLSMIVILTIQCLFFADGGLLALGANVWNMAFYGCFVRSDEPGARRRIWMRTASMSMASPAGTPSSTTPIAGPCDSPKIVTFTRSP